MQTNRQTSTPGMPSAVTTLGRLAPFNGLRVSGHPAMNCSSSARATSSASCLGGLFIR